MTLDEMLPSEARRSIKDEISVYLSKNADNIRNYKGELKTSLFIDTFYAVCEKYPETDDSTQYRKFFREEFDSICKRLEDEEP